MLTLLLTAGAELVAFVLRLAARNLYAGWALVVSALPALAYVMDEFFRDLRGARGLTDSDTGMLGLELSVVTLAVLARGRFSRLFFWLGWTLNLGLIGVFVYVLALWRPFA